MITYFYMHTRKSVTFYNRARICLTSRIWRVRSSMKKQTIICTSSGVVPIPDESYEVLMEKITEEFKMLQITISDDDFTSHRKHISKYIPKRRLYLLCSSIYPTRYIWRRS